jgi:polyhydroxyalkanoate synthesis regulator phasin
VQSTVGSASMTRERAQDLVDDVVRRAEHGAARAGRGVREAGQRQAEAAAGVGDRLRDAIPDLRVATREDLRRLSSKIERLAARIDRLEGKTRRPRASKPAAKSKATPKRGGAAKRATVGKPRAGASAPKRSGASRQRKR